jgi:hypothetical protein
MEKRKIILRCLLTLAVGSTLLLSCLNDPEPVALDYLPDAIIQKITDNQEEKYALVFWVYGNKELESGTVEGPTTGSWLLDKNSSNNQILNLFPEEEDYSSTMPETGLYEFTVSSTQTDEAPVTMTDELEDEELGAVVIDTVKFNNLELTTEWQAVSGADRYLVRLYDSAGEMVFISEQIAGNQTEYTFNTVDQGWTGSTLPVQGEAYSLELLAVLYESDASVNPEYNIQCISIGSKEITWGE